MHIANFQSKHFESVNARVRYISENLVHVDLFIEHRLSHSRTMGRRLWHAIAEMYQLEVKSMEYQQQREEETDGFK